MKYRLPIAPPFALSLAFTCGVLFLNPVMAQAQKETDRKLASELVYCSALAYGGVETAGSEERKRQWWSIASNFFTAASRLATEQELAEFKPAAIERRQKLFAALEMSDKEAGSEDNPLSVDLKYCVALMKDNAARIKELAPPKKAASPRPPASPADPRLFRPGVTTPPEMKSVLGRPFMERNRGGRFSEL